jgi:hypothetical protein
MIYVGQNAFKIYVDTGINLTGVSSSLIFLRYASPTLSTGVFAATVVTSTAGIIQYECTSTDSFEKGVWSMWAHVTHSTGRVSIGDPFLVTVKAEGES